MWNALGARSEIRCQVSSQWLIYFPSPYRSLVHCNTHAALIGLYDGNCCSVLPPMKDLFESEKFESEKFVFRVAGVFTGVCVEEQRLFNQPDTHHERPSSEARAPSIASLTPLTASSGGKVKTTPANIGPRKSMRDGSQNGPRATPGFLQDEKPLGWAHAVHA